MDKDLLKHKQELLNKQRNLLGHDRCLKYLIEISEIFVYLFILHNTHFNISYDLDKQMREIQRNKLYW